METQDHLAFLESILTDESFTLEEKIEAEAELQEYYLCLEDIVGQLYDEELSEDQRQSAYADYLALTGSEPQTEFENGMEAIYDSFRSARAIIGA